ncbi:skin secretory protein xP2-like [Cavia porcellus]|uniref:skin secretory protein xP2-like n=1 Tax=Cavia porcellus TaxID=10141 RepID=UPI002FE14BCA
MEPLEQDSLDSCPIHGCPFLETPRGDIFTPHALMLGRSMSDVLDTSLEVDLQEDPPAEALDQGKHTVPTKAEAMHEEDWVGGPDPAQAEVPPAEPTPAPPAAPSPALIPQEEPAPGSPSAPGAGQGLLVAPQQSSAPELPRGPAPAPPLPFPCITVAHVLVYAFALTFWLYINNRILFK